MSERDMHTGCTIITGISKPKEVMLDLTVRGCDWSPIDASEHLDRLLVAARRAVLIELAAITQGRVGSMAMNEPI